jgi:phosphatidyl-myo-inositol dimannoside synthase
MHRGLKGSIVTKTDATVCKVLLFTGSFPPGAGGSIEYISNIFSKLPAGSATINTGGSNTSQAREYDLAYPQNVVRRNFIVNVLDEAKSGRVRKFFGLFQWVFSGFWMIARDRPDVVQIGEYNYSFIAALLGKIVFKTPYVLYTYAEEITFLRTRPLRLRIFVCALKNASAVITVSEYTKNLLVECGAQPDRIFKVLPSVSEKKRRVVPTDEIDSIRDHYTLQGRQILLTVARLEERKGHLSVIDALPGILALYPDLIYIIVGTGPFEERLKKHVVLAGLSKNVVFAGRASDNEVAALYELCDVFLMPHRQLPDTLDTEGCPTVFLEAGAHGKPVIGGNAGGVADAILDNETGYIIDGTNPTHITEKVLALLGNPGLSGRMGDAGRRYVDSLRPENSAAIIAEINMSLMNDVRRPKRRL